MNATAAKIKLAHRTLPVRHGRAPGVRLGGCAHRWVSPGLPARLCAPLPGFHTALYFQVSALPLLAASPVLSQARWHRKPTARRGRGLSGCCPPAAGAGKAKWAAPGAPGASAAPLPALCRGISPPLVGGRCVCCGAPAQSCPWVRAQGTVGWAGWQLVCYHPPPPVQIPRDTQLVAEIPFISLNCVTSNTAGGRFSVDLSYWGLSSTKPGRKKSIMHGKLLL